MNPQLEKDLQDTMSIISADWKMQNNYYDKASNFIYKVGSLDECLIEIERTGTNKEYALHRWYNYMTSIQCEYIFCEYGAVHEKDKYNHDVDIYIDAAGADAILDYYQDNGKVDSRLVMVAVGTNERNVNILGMTFGQLAIIGSGGYTPEDVKDVMAIMESGKWDIEKIITHEYSLDQIEDAIKMAGNADEALNVVIKY